MFCPLAFERRSRTKLIDQTIGRTVMAVGSCVGGQFGKDDLGELVADLDTPLIETVDAPDYT
jgi:hypothetical protein